MNPFSNANRQPERCPVDKWIDRALAALVWGYAAFGVVGSIWLFVMLVAWMCR